MPRDFFFYVNHVILLGRAESWSQGRTPPPSFPVSVVPATFSFDGRAIFIRVRSPVPDPTPLTIRKVFLSRPLRGELKPLSHIGDFLPNNLSRPTFFRSVDLKSGKDPGSSQCPFARGPIRYSRRLPSSFCGCFQQQRVGFRIFLYPLPMVSPLLRAVQLEQIEF